MSTITIPSEIYVIIALFVSNFRTIMSLSGVEKSAQNILNLINQENFLFFKHICDSVFRPPVGFARINLENVNLKDIVCSTRSFTVNLFQKMVAKVTIRQIKAVFILSDGYHMTFLDYYALVDDYIKNTRNICTSQHESHPNIDAVSDFYHMALEFIWSVFSEFRGYNFLSRQFDYVVCPSSMLENEKRGVSSQIDNSNMCFHRNFHVRRWANNKKAFVEFINQCENDLFFESHARVQRTLFSGTPPYLADPDSKHINQCVVIRTLH
jgi:hypothetical protein